MNITCVFLDLLDPTLKYYITNPFTRITLSFLDLLVPKL